MNRPKLEWLPYLAGLLAVTVVVVSLAAVAFYLERLHHLERAQVATGNIVQLQAQNIGNLFDKVDVALQSGALYHRHQQLIGPVDADELNEYIKNLETVVPEVDGIRILDKDGLVRYGHNIPVSPRTNLSDRTFFLKARDDAAANGTLIVDGPLFARIAQKWVIVFARRLNTLDGSFAGVIYANLATNRLESVLSSVALGPDGAATIRMANLALVHRVPETRNAIGSQNVSVELRNAISARPEGGDYIATTALDGIERSNAYRKIGKYPFYVIVGLSIDDYLGGWRQNALIIVGLAILTILISALASQRGYRAHQTVAADLRLRNELNATLRKTLAERDQLNDTLAGKARQAEAASMAKSAFLSNMSHEMRSPLHQIQGLAHLIGRDPLTSRQADHLKLLENSVQHMTSQVDAVLQLTQIESAGLELSEEPLELSEVVDSAVEKYRRKSQDKNISFNVRELPAAPGLVGDRQHIQQALMNYLSNAVRFTQAGGIEVRARVVDEQEANITIRFEVEDSGLGIKPEDLPRLFNVFEQVDNSPTRRYGGLGVGLAITRKIAEALGGQAGCESIYGQGSTFWFSVRLKKQSGSAD